MAKDENIMLDITCRPRDSKFNGPRVVSGLGEDFISRAPKKLVPPSISVPHPKSHK